MDAITTDVNFEKEDAPVQAKAKPPILPDASLLWAVFRRRVWLFLAVTLVVMGLVAARTWKTTPLYAATSTVVIVPQQAQVVDTVRAVNAPILADSASIDTEVQILSSATLAGRVADALHLERYPEFGGGAGAMLSEADTTAGPGMHPLARAVQSRMTIARIGLSYLIGITAKIEDRQLAAEIANEYARQYIAQQAEQKNSNIQSISGDLQTRLEDMEKRVLAADQAVQQYKISNNLMSSQGSTMAEQEVSNLGSQIAGARADLADKTARLSAARAQVSRGGGGADIGAALGSGTVSGFRAREAEVSQRLADLTTRYGERYGDVIKARQELIDVRQQMQREIDRIISSLAAEQQASASRLASLTGSQAAAKGSLAGNNAAAVGLLELERKADAARSIYQAFLTRSKETVSQQGLERADARIDALSRVPILPYTPNIPLALAFALLLGPVAGLASIAVAEYLDGKVSTKQDVENKLRVRYIGAIPELQSTLEKKSRTAETPADYLLEHPASAFAEAFRSLRTATLLKGKIVPPVVAVTSALPREGKSTTSICLARTMVGAGSRTVLVDCDIRRRSVSQEFMPEGWTGILDYLSGAKPLEDALFKDPYSDLFVLGSTVAPEFTRDLFADMPIETFLTELRKHFDVVVLDTAPVLGIAETRAIAAAADTVVMLARWRSTSIKAADAAIEMLLAANANLRGVALNLVDIKRYASTGYQDVYSYHKQFKGYYQN